MTDEQLLNEINELLRTMPPKDNVLADDQETFAWLGRASAILTQWNQYSGLGTALMSLRSSAAATRNRGYHELMVLIHQARSDLLMKTGGPAQVTFAQGKPHDYYDHVRKIIEQAATELFFVDRYLNSDFVARYLPAVKPGVAVRLIAREAIHSLIPAVELFAQQHRLTIEVRASQSIHQRVFFIDRKFGYTSGDSFKDGAFSSAATVAELTDAFAPTFSHYETLWAASETQFPKPVAAIPS